MLQALLLAAAGVSALDELASRWGFTIPGRKYSRVKIESVVVFSHKELSAWDTELSVDERVAIYRRGLLRQQYDQEMQN